MNMSKRITSHQLRKLLKPDKPFSLLSRMKRKVLMMFAFHSCYIPLPLSSQKCSYFITQKINGLTFSQMVLFWGKVYLENEWNRFVFIICAMLLDPWVKLFTVSAQYCIFMATLEHLNLSNLAGCCARRCGRMESPIQQKLF